MTAPSDAGRIITDSTHSRQRSARIVFRRDAVVGPVRRRTFGAFVEHLGRCVYTGIYEPGHPSATAEGFRADVAELVRELGISTVRYPGGNFVSGYQWEDGVGPREDRPVRLDLAWHTTETNAFGLDEFISWCRFTDQEPMMAVNLGTRGVLDAVHLLEYANHPGGTALSEQRKANGTPEPHDIRMWCLGNEMDGPWQVGHMSADAYGALAARTASAMRMQDPNLELVVCGSSHSGMPTFGEWERTVLEHTFDLVDYISCHTYYQERDNDLGSFLASSIDLQRFIDTVVAAADFEQRRRRSNKQIMLSFDEWNVWYVDRYDAEKTTWVDWPQAPRLLEDVYNVADAIVVGSLLITLLANTDRVAAASLAQLVNVIAPIMTEPGGSAWRQTTFFPFSLTSRLAQGDVVKPRIASDTYPTALYGDVPLADSVATWDDTMNRLSVFMVNRSPEEGVDVTVDLSDFGALRVVESRSLHAENPRVFNSHEQPDAVTVTETDVLHPEDSVFRGLLPPASWHVFVFEAVVSDVA